MKYVLVICGLAAGMVWGAMDGPNGVSDEKDLPDELREADLIWSVKLGTHQYSAPIFRDGRIYLGLNDVTMQHPSVRRTGGGLLMCLDEGTGDMVWQFAIPRYMEGTKPPFHFNHWRCGVCSTPAVDEKHMYIVGTRGEILCLDRNGQADGNDGPVTDEAAYMGYADPTAELAPTDGDMVWRYDMIKELGVVPHDVCGSSPLLDGNFLYACTSNGQDDKHERVANPLAPSLIVLDKRTGKLVATDGELIGERLFHGLWSSPIMTTVKGQKMILFGGGDGILYAFEPLKPADLNDKPVTLKKLWQRDCNPAGYRDKPCTGWREKRPDGPSEIIATPVVHEGRVYVAIGQSPIHGRGQGALTCIDAVGGEIIWQSTLVDRSLCTVSIADGLLYIADLSGNLHCFDAAAGKRLWVHDLQQQVWSGSTFVADGKVYVGTEGNKLWILRAGPEKEVLWQGRTDSPPITITASNGRLYVPTQRGLYVYKAKQGG
ncbi:MAG: PQQ-like beta-propeller repeat protein [Phycisphaerae bacterium]|nr:PQQ-like beta-propeller repeat protein [Phycisphaerae bacterium]